MFLRLILPLLSLAICHPAAYRIWGMFTRYEVAENAAAITANGSADDLRKGFHQRRTWLRFWPWLALSVAAALPLWGHWLALALAFLSLGILLAGFFARYFTPWLNVARGLPEFQASSDSASWPDAAVWKRFRAAPRSPWAATTPQVVVNYLLKDLLTHTWLGCRIAYAVGLLLALAAFLHY